MYINNNNTTIGEDFQNLYYYTQIMYILLYTFISYIIGYSFIYNHTMMNYIFYKNTNTYII